MHRTRRKRKTCPTMVASHRRNPSGVLITPALSIAHVILYCRLQPEFLRTASFGKNPSQLTTNRWSLPFRGHFALEGGAWSGLEYFRSCYSVYTSKSRQSMSVGHYLVPARCSRLHSLRTLKHTYVNLTPQILPDRKHQCCHECTQTHSEGI